MLMVIQQCLNEVIRTLAAASFYSGSPNHLNELNSLAPPLQCISSTFSFSSFPIESMHLHSPVENVNCVSMHNPQLYHPSPLVCGPTEFRTTNRFRKQSVV